MHAGAPSGVDSPTDPHHSLKVPTTDVWRGGHPGLNPQPPTCRPQGWPSSSSWDKALHALPAHGNSAGAEPRPWASASPLAASSMWLIKLVWLVFQGQVKGCVLGRCWRETLGRAGLLLSYKAICVTPRDPLAVLSQPIHPPSLWQPSPMQQLPVCSAGRTYNPLYLPALSMSHT